MKKTVEDEKTRFIKSFEEFGQEKGIDSTTMTHLLEDVFRTMIRKKYETDENFDVIISVENGDLEIRRIRYVVDDNSEDIWDFDKITLTDAREIDAEFQVGEEFAEDISLEDFGRRAILTARQTLIQKIKEQEKGNLYDKYKDLVGDIIVGEVYQQLKRDYLILDNEGNELILPKSIYDPQNPRRRVDMQIPKDRFRKGDFVKAVIHKVEKINGNPRIILSRTSPVFLERLFEAEIPEIYDGLITIKNIVREPGERAKVAVESYDDRIDPVGACVGMKGSRIHSIVRELNNENIDVINFTNNLDLYVSRALSPAKITSVKVEEEEKAISVFMKPDQVSLAIGKGGHNIKLASKLVGYNIEVFRDTDDFVYEEVDDIDLIEFEDEIEMWVIEELRRIGLDTAKSILDLEKGELLRRTDLEEETIDFIFETLSKEFEEDDDSSTTEEL